MAWVASRRSASWNSLVIGGFAVTPHGYPRETADLDLLVRKSKRGHWLAALSSLVGYELRNDGEIFVQLESREASAWPIDLMLVSDETFARMESEALEVSFPGAKGRVPCVEHWIALKLHALKHGRVHRYLKDFLDVEGMVRKNRLDLSAEKYRQLFLKYGTLDIYEKITRAVAGEG